VATFSRRGRRWRAAVCVQGVRESRSFDTRTEAREWAAARERALLVGDRGVVSAGTLHGLFERYVREVCPLHRGERWEVVRIERIKRELADLPLRGCVPAVFAAWRDARLKMVSAASVQREMTLLRSVFESARRDWGLVDVNPLKDIRRPGSSPPRRRRILDTEIAAICEKLSYVNGVRPETLSQEVAVAFLLAIETAMRAGELLSLRWVDVDLRARVAHLSATKNGDPRDVPLSTRAVELIELMPRSRATVFAVSAATRDALFRRARDAAGLRDLHFHDSRAEATTRLARRLDVLLLARVTGHRDPRSLMVYYRETAADIARLLE